MKKALKLSLILSLAIFIICIMGNVYAELNCSVDIKLDETEFNKNDEFTVDIDLSNIQSEQGIISLGATLEYDKESLELIKIEGKNGWETPTDGTSYNANNGKIAITRSGFAKSDETVFTLTFKVKEESKQNLIVVLRNITIADGTKPVKINVIHKNITIIDGIPNVMPTIELETEPITNTSDKNETKEESNTKTIITIICISLIILIIVFIIVKNAKLKKKKRKYMNKGKRMKH